MPLWLMVKRGPFTIETRLASPDVSALTQHLESGEIIWPMAVLESAGWIRYMRDPWVDDMEIEWLRDKDVSRGSTSHAH